MDLKRRNLLKGSATIAAGTLIGTSQSWAGANDRINVAVIGLNGRGRSHIAGHQQAENVEVTTLCDVDKIVLAKRAAEFESRYDKKVNTVVDMRDAFSDAELDAVSIATPNHWHALATIWACQAGKDVYVEKPGAHNIFEGRKMIEAAYKYRFFVLTLGYTQSISSIGLERNSLPVSSPSPGKESAASLPHSLF